MKPVEFVGTESSRAIFINADMVLSVFESGQNASTIEFAASFNGELVRTEVEGAPEDIVEKLKCAGRRA